MENKSKLKQQLTRFFQPSKLLHSSCNSTSSSSTIFTNSSSSPNTVSTRSDEPVFITHDVIKTYDINNKLDRSLSFNSAASSRMLSFDLSRICKPTKQSQNNDVVANVSKKVERRVRESGELYDTGCKEGQTCPPSSPLKEVSKLYHHYNEEEKKEKDVNMKSTKKKKKKRPVVFKNAYGFSTCDENDESEFFRSDEVVDNEDESETFFTSRSFSSDSCEFYKRPSSLKNKKKKNKKKTKHCSRKISNNKNEEKGASGVPVIKKSNDPYVDFRDSMLEMIVERQIFGAKDLEKLLLSYLSLNSPLHHCMILRAFADISQVLFGY